MKQFLFFALVSIPLIISSCSDARNNPRDLSPQNQEIDNIIWNAIFQDLDGNEVSVQDFAGKVVMVDFWETWCSPCLQVFPDLDSLQSEYPDDFVVMTVNLNNSDSVEEVINFRENRPYDFTYTIDVNKIGDKVINTGIPFKIFLDTEGYLIKSELGITGNDYEDIKKIIEQYKTS